MARTVGVLPPPKDRRRVVHVKGKHKVVETHPSPDTTTFTVEDPQEEEHPGTANFLEICWPAIFGIVLAIIAERLRLKIDNHWGDVGDRLFFPFVQIASRPELGLGDSTSGIATLTLYLQFPLTGLYATWNLSRHHRLMTTMVQILFVYGVCAFVLWLLTAPGSSHGL